MKGIIYLGPKTIEVQEVPTPVAGEGQALIQVKAAGICGSDLGIYGGTHPRAKAPLVPGHEYSGILMNDTKKYKAGTKVCVNPLLSCGECTPCKSGNSHVCNTLKLDGIDCDGGMAEYSVVAEDMLVAVPDEVSFELAAFIEPVAVAVHTLRETGYVPGDNALVYGCGTIGLVVAQTLKEFGCTNVTMVEADAVRAEVARGFGFDVKAAIGLDLAALKEEKTNGDGFDWVFDCAGVQAVAGALLDAVKVRGKIVVVAGYKYPAEMPFFMGMAKETSILFVRVYRPIDVEIAAELVAKQPAYDQFITHKLPIEEAQKGFDLLTTPGTGAIKVMYTF
ncbi:MAG: alcohol dehydrogenase catalytic domain-containing protein [Lachnospiraceae bacterium]